MQKDLFQIITEPVNEATNVKTTFLDRHKLVLRLDQLLLSLIIFFVVGVFVFTLGIERGKQVTAKVLEIEREKNSQILTEMTQRLKKKNQLEEFRGDVVGTQAMPLTISAPVAEPLSGDTAADVISTEIAPLKPVSSAPAGQFTIQMITYTQQSQADVLIEKLKKAGYNGFIIPSGKFLQVCAGGFTTKPEAKKALTTLKSQGLAPQDAYVRPMAR